MIADNLSGKISGVEGIKYWNLIARKKTRNFDNKLLNIIFLHKLYVLYVFETFTAFDDPIRYTQLLAHFYFPP